VAAPADLIWSKAFIAARQRFDGADIVHLLRAAAEHLDWEHLLAAFRPYPELLLAYLNLFQYCYPTAASALPNDVGCALRARSRRPEPDDPSHPFRGPLLDRHFPDDGAGMDEGLCPRNS
jgi:hypothetical protein